MFSMIFEYTMHIGMRVLSCMCDDAAVWEEFLNTEIKNAVMAAEKEAQYDECAKRLLEQKEILAHILERTVEEFQGMDPKEIVPLIEGKPYISRVPTAPGLTNQALEVSGRRIVGLNTENAEKHEGLIRFDVIFYVRMRNGISQMIINVEAQKDEPGKYNILNRAIFYASRLISSQKERDFENTNYNDIKCVYSIWVCMNMAKDSLCHIRLTKNDMVGCYDWKGRLDLINIVMIGLAKKLSEHDDMLRLHRLLGALFSQVLTPEERLDLMHKEYDIQIDEDFRRDVSVMCNLSQGIKEAGIAEGEARGRAEKEAQVIVNMYRNGFTLEQISLATGKDAGEITAIIKKGKLAFRK